MSVLSLVSLLLAIAHADVSSLGFDGAPTLPTVASIEPKNASLITVSFDCYLTTHVHCGELERAFFRADPFIQPASKGAAELVVEVRAWRLPGDIDQYELKFKGTGDLPVFKLAGEPLRVNGALEEHAQVTAVLRHLVKGTAVFHRVTEYKTGNDGQFVITYKARDGGTAPPKSNDSPWSFQLGGGFELKQQGVRDIGGYAYGNATYDTPTWLVAVMAGGSFRYVSAKTDAGDLSATALDAGGGVLVARSVAKHWSVMALARESHKPVQNWETRTQAHVGVEYELLPFLESNDDAFTVSYIVGGNYETYVQQNVNGNMQEALATHALSVYYVKHVDRFDFSVAGAVTSLVNDPTRFAVGAQTAIKLRVTRELSVELAGNVGYKNNVVNAPAHPDASNPLLLLIGGATATEPLTYQLTLSVTYTWGNTLLRQRDTRWQFTPNNLPVNF